MQQAVTGFKPKTPIEFSASYPGSSRWALEKSGLLTGTQADLVINLMARAQNDTIPEEVAFLWDVPDQKNWRSGILTLLEDLSADAPRVTQWIRTVQKGEAALTRNEGKVRKWYHMPSWGRSSYTRERHNIAHYGTQLDRLMTFIDGLMIMDGGEHTPMLKEAYASVRRAYENIPREFLNEVPDKVPTLDAQEQLSEPTAVRAEKAPIITELSISTSLPKPAKPPAPAYKPWGSIWERFGQNPRSIEEAFDAPTTHLGTKHAYAQRVLNGQALPGYANIDAVELPKFLRDASHRGIAEDVVDEFTIPPIPQPLSDATIEKAADGAPTNNRRTFLQRLAGTGREVEEPTASEPAPLPKFKTVAPIEATAFDSRILPYELSTELCEAIGHSNAGADAKEEVEILRQEVMTMNRLHIGVARKMGQMMPPSKQKADAERHLNHSVAQLNQFLDALDAVSIPMELEDRVIHALMERGNGYGLRYSSNRFEPGDVNHSVGARVVEQLERFQQAKSGPDAPRL